MLVPAWIQIWKVLKENHRCTLIPIFITCLTFQLGRSCSCIIQTRKLLLSLSGSPILQAIGFISKSVVTIPSDIWWALMSRLFPIRRTCKFVFNSCHQMRVFLLTSVINLKSSGERFLTNQASLPPWPSQRSFRWSFKGPMDIQKENPIHTSMRGNLWLEEERKNHHKDPWWIKITLRCLKLIPCLQKTT